LAIIVLTDRKCDLCKDVARVDTLRHEMRGKSTLVFPSDDGPEMWVCTSIFRQKGGMEIDAPSRGYRY
jgi:hypothetical protein